MKKEFNISIGPLGLLSLIVSVASLTVGLISLRRSGEQDGETAALSDYGTYEETEV
jgi:hypothetical protein